MKGSYDIKRQVGIIGCSVIGIVGLIVFMSSTPSNSEKAPEPKKTPEQAAADERLGLAKVSAIFGAQQLKKSMKDPESFELQSLIVMDDGAACYHFRAKNSFGGIFPSTAVLTPRGHLFAKELVGNDFALVWNKECADKAGIEIAEFARHHI
jgi:hypothetical protein